MSVNSSSQEINLQRCADALEHLSTTIFAHTLNDGPEGEELKKAIVETPARFLHNPNCLICTYLRAVK